MAEFDFFQARNAYEARQSAWQWLLHWAYVLDASQEYGYARSDRAQCKLAYMELQALIHAAMVQRER